jgi:hypothetical protein
VPQEALLKNDFKRCLLYVSNVVAILAAYENREKGLSLAIVSKNELIEAVEFFSRL